MKNVLILGGTTEASALAQAVAARGLSATFSYAGRVSRPKPQPLPTRVGGFGGVAGLVDFIARERITHIVDATHPFAAQMSRHALAAAAHTGARALALTRPPWREMEADRWQRVASIEAAVEALDGPAERILLAIGRLHLDAFSARPQHHYLLRLVEEPAVPPPLARYKAVIDRGPFTLENDLELLKTERITRIVCKNAGGSGAASKILAARALSLPVTMIDRPRLPPHQEAHSVDEVLAWLEA
ncbi:MULTISPECIES: cobalt-precorrin-6A reductase [unclassified Halomonas]|uniref:cobalt-precorrin-6A reductase n=1 Tax=unclassified Halomonas TaxID=2609666 RepID=UPI0020768210|nr:MULTISPECIES: cobalt-precorrin-6A reductase [unclassified Halomonas]